MSIELSRQDLQTLEATLRDFLMLVEDENVTDHHPEKCKDCIEGIDGCYRPLAYWRGYARTNVVRRLRAAVETHYLALADTLAVQS